jgi:hypothetical protein
VFPNGHRLLLEKAIAAVDDPALTAHADALLQGCNREDFWSVAGREVRGLGITHFAYAAPWRARRLYARAVLEHRRSARTGFFWLGRAAHLVSEMAAPVHAQGSIHWRGDAFELYLEDHAAELRALPVAEVAAADASALARDLARRAREFPADRTRNLPGFLAWKLSLLQRPSPEQVLEQVRVLVPLGAGYTAALCRRFIAEVSA